MIGHYKHFILATVLLTFAACTNRTSPVVLSDNTSTTSLPTNPNLFDSGTGTSTTSTINTSNLFDTTLTPAETTATSTVTTTTVNNAVNSSNVCMSPNSNVLASSSSAPISSACYTSGSYLPQNYLYNAGYQSYGNMDYCYRLVANYGQQVCSYYGNSTSSTASANYASMFNTAQMALIRCYRQVIAQQAAAAQWAPDQGQSYQGNDQMMLFVLAKLMGGGF